MDMTLIPVEQVNEGVRLHLTVAEAAASRMHRKPNRSAARRLGRGNSHPAARCVAGCSSRPSRCRSSSRTATVSGSAHGAGSRTRPRGDVRAGCRRRPDATDRRAQVERDRQRARGRYIDDGAFLILRDPDGVEVLRRGIVP